MKHLLSPLDFSVEELDNLMDLAKDIEATSRKIRTCMRGQKTCHSFLRTKYTYPIKP